MRTILLMVLLLDSLALGACGSTSGSGPAAGFPDAAPHDGAAIGPDTAGGSDAGTDCGYAPVHNDPACPASYDQGLTCRPCSPIGLKCLYPGAGDGMPNGCAYTAGLTCVGFEVCPGDAGGGDGGPDGGSGAWAATQ